MLLSYRISDAPKIFLQVINCNGSFFACLSTYGTTQAQCRTHSMLYCPSATSNSLNLLVIEFAKKRGVACNLLASIHPKKCFSNTCRQNGYHAPLLDDDSITSKLTHVSECDIVLEQYRTLLLRSLLHLNIIVVTKSNLQHSVNHLHCLQFLIKGLYR